MTTLPLLGDLLVGPGWVATLVVLAITPGVHLLVSTLLERRRVNFTNDYSAVLIGDPMLAVATGIGVELAAGQLVVLADWRVGLVGMAGAAAFGRWQSRQELAEGRYSSEQVRSLSKRFHQYVVYPVLGYLVTVAVVSGIMQWEPLLGTAMLLLVGGWAALAVEAWRTPKLGHGTWPHSRIPQT